MQRGRGVLDFERKHAGAPAFIQFRIGFPQPLGDPGHLGSRLVEGGAGPEPGRDEQLAKRIVLFRLPQTRERCPHLRLLLIHAFPGGGQVELRRQYADDGIGGAAERHRLAKRLWITMEAAFEVGVRQHHHTVGAGALLVGSEQTAQARRRPQHRKQVGGSEPGGNVARMVQAGFAETHFTERGHVGEHGVLALPLHIIPARDLNASAHWIGQVRQALPHKDQPRRIGVGEGLENDGVDDAEDGGIRANAERQHSNAGQRIAGTPAKHANSKLKVANQRHDEHGSTGIRVCVGSKACAWSVVGRSPGPGPTISGRSRTDKNFAML